MSVLSVRHLWARYQNQLQTRPYRTQILTSTVLWAAGDVIAQTVGALSTKAEGKEETNVNRDKHEHIRIDWKRVMVTSGFGAFFVGPVGHSWYEGLEYVVNRTLKLQPNSLPFIATKLAADSLLFGPIHLLAFFTYMGLAEGKSLDEVINFKFVPVRHQLLYVNVFCLLDSAFLSWYKHQDDAPWKRNLLSLVMGSDQDAK